MEPKRTPGQAEGSEQDVDIALDQNPERQKARMAAAQRQQQQAIDEEPGRTPGKAEGTQDQADGSLRRPK